MPLFVTGINHDTAPVAVRERLVLSERETEALLPRLVGEAGLEEALLLETCNRSELYGVGEEAALRAALGILCARSGISGEQLEPYLYRHEEDAAVRHVFRVASGLDSLVLGEPQILGQVKQAWQLARSAGSLGPILDRLLQHAFAVAKRVRSDTAIGRHPVSIAFAAVRLAERLFTDLAEATVLLIGAGEMVELAARHLTERHIPRLIVANRTLAHAQEIAARHGGYAITLEELPAHLAEADVVIASTAAPQPIVDRRMIEDALARRHRRPMFLVDIAVPRDIDPAVGELPDVYLYTIDDLRLAIADNLATRREAAAQAELIVDLQVGHFLAWRRARDGSRLLRRLRERVFRQREELFDRALAMLENGKDPREVLHWFAHSLTNRFLHAPSAKLREAAGQGDLALLEAAARLFETRAGGDAA